MAFKKVERRLFGRKQSPRSHVVAIGAMFLFLAACGDDSSSNGPSDNGPVEVKSGTMTDSRDGQTYKTVTIGSQTWMAENLNYETDFSFCYNSEETNCAKYGRLYRWAAAVGKSESECGPAYICSLPSGNIQGVCPNGWHLPSKVEWETLFNAVGGPSTAGWVLKSTSGWNSSGNGTDAFGFSALPAGYRTGGYRIGNEGYDGEGDYAYFWSSTEDFSGYAYCMFLDFYIVDANLHDNIKNYGFSVRCVKD